MVGRLGSTARSLNRPGRMRKSLVLGIALSFLVVALLTGTSGRASAAPSQGSSGTPMPYQFASVPDPTAVAATPGQLLVLSGCTEVLSVPASGGTPQPFATLESPSKKCTEGAIAISPGLGNYPAGQVYVLVGSSLYIIPAGGGGPDPVNGTTVPSNLSGNYAGLTFDYFGAFGYGLLATGGSGGNIYSISPAGTPHWLGSVGTYVEGPTVTPSTFGTTVDGTLLMAAEGKSTLYSFAPDGSVRTFGSWKNSEAVSIVPGLACSYSTSGDAYFVADSGDNALRGFPLSQLQSFGAASVVGQGLVLSEYKGLGVGLLNPTTGATSQLVGLSGTLEGAAYVTCPVGITQTFDPSSPNGALSNADLIGFDPATGELVAANRSANPEDPSQVFFVYCTVQGCSLEQKTTTVGGDPAAVAYDPQTDELFVANNGSDNLTILDGTHPTGPSLGSVPTGTGPDAVVYSPTNNKLYVANYGNQNLSVYSEPNNVFSNSIIVLTGNPYGMVYDPIDQNVYVVGNVGATGTLWEIHGFSVVGSLSFTAATLGLPSGSNATAVTVNTSSGLLYVTLSQANAVAIVDPGFTSAPPSLVTTVPVGTDPKGIAYNPANGLVLVSNFEDGTIGIIQGQTMVATISLGAGSDPGVLVYDPVTEYVYLTANYSVPDPRIILGAGGG